MIIFKENQQETPKTKMPMLVVWDTYNSTINKIFGGELLVFPFKMLILAEVFNLKLKSRNFKMDSSLTLDS